MPIFKVKVIAQEEIEVSAQSDKQALRYAYEMFEKGKINFTEFEFICEEKEK